MYWSGFLPQFGPFSVAMTVIPSHGSFLVGHLASSGTGKLQEVCSPMSLGSLGEGKQSFPMKLSPRIYRVRGS